jgi:hypothetical protein
MDLIPAFGGGLGEFVLLHNSLHTTARYDLKPDLGPSQIGYDPALRTLVLPKGGLRSGLRKCR